MIYLKGEDHGTHPQEIQYRTGQDTAHVLSTRTYHQERNRENTGYREAQILCTPETAE